MVGRDTANIEEPGMEFSRERKLAYLASLTEDQFRDRVVRPVFERAGLDFVRDTCGADEEGKDCIFVGKDTLRRRLVYAIQTKNGNVNMSSKVAANVVTAATQLQTALNTSIYLTQSKEHVKPDYVILCASGVINNAARKYICDDIKDPRIGFYDANDLLPLIDSTYPEFWFGIDAKLFPYLRRLKRDLLESSDTLVLGDVLGGRRYCPIRDDTYVTLFVHRIIETVEKQHGEVTVSPKFDQIPVQSILQRRERLVLIRGEGGAGKTTALRRLALELVEESLKAKEPRIPVLLMATDLVTDTTRLALQAAAQTKGMSDDDAGCFGDLELGTGRVVLLIDALDEVSSDTARAAVVQKIDEFHREYPECYVVLTSRLYASVNRLAGLRSFTQYNLTALDLRQAAKIVNNLYSGRKLSKEDATETLRRLQDVHGVALNPMLVTVFVATSDFSRRDIPPNITEIFSKFTELMLGRWDEKKGMAQQYETKIKDFVLCQVAFKMHSARTRTIPLELFESEVASLLEARGYKTDIQRLLDELINRSNLLRVDTDGLEFRHHILQEFFAGRGVQDSRYLASVIADEWWRKPIVFFFGNSPTNQSGLEPLKEAALALKETDRYQAAITIGLATQACYLAETPAKVDTLGWVVHALADSCEEEVKAISAGIGGYDIYSFALYYLFARDAVASDPITAVTEKVLAESSGSPEHDRHLFWCIVGMIETGRFADAEKLIAKFKPQDLRLLVALHMGSFYAAHIRISTAEHKKAAERVCKLIQPRVKFMLSQAAKEMKGFLLEMRRGEVAVVNDKAPDLGVGEDLDKSQSQDGPG